LSSMELVMGPLPPRSGRPLDLTRFEKLETPHFTRTYVTFAGDDDDYVPAYLLVPKALRGPAPAMLCLHQTTRIGKGEPAGIGGIPDLRYAQELAERGYVGSSQSHAGRGCARIAPGSRI